MANLTLNQKVSVGTLIFVTVGSLAVVVALVVKLNKVTHQIEVQAADFDTLSSRVDRVETLAVQTIKARIWEETATNPGRMTLWSTDRKRGWTIETAGRNLNFYQLKDGTTWVLTHSITGREMSTERVLLPPRSVPGKD